MDDQSLRIRSFSLTNNLVNTLVEVPSYSGQTVKFFKVNMDGPNPTESKIARDEGFIIRTRMNTVNGHSDQRDQVKGSQNKICSIHIPVDFEHP